jgi:hypothetical protein
MEVDAGGGVERWTSRVPESTDLLKSLGVGLKNTLGYSMIYLSAGGSCRRGGGGVESEIDSDRCFV